MRRRDFIVMLAGTGAAWPLRAGEFRSTPVIGYLEGQSPAPLLLAEFKLGLNEFGYLEDRNVRIECRYAYGQREQLSALAAELVERQVTLIVTAGGANAAHAARQATSSIPILFLTGLDPVREKLVASLGRPGGNATGVSHYNVPLMSKLLELLNDLVLTKPGIEPPLKLACLMNDETDPQDQREQTQEVKDMARSLGLELYFARSEDVIATQFASMSHKNVKALLVRPDPLFVRHRKLIVELAARFELPACYRNREFVEAGGLMSYGPSLPESWRQIGRYAGRILGGARPEDLPVMMPRKYELVINRKCATSLGLSLKRILADEVI